VEARVETTSVVSASFQTTGPDHIFKSSIVNLTTGGFDNSPHVVFELRNDRYDIRGQDIPHLSVRLTSTFQHLVHALAYLDELAVINVGVSAIFDILNDFTRYLDREGGGGAT